MKSQLPKVSNQLPHSFKSLTMYNLATATIDEYLTMVSGGLAGSTPHMISATITAISRLVFDFKGRSYIAPLSLVLTLV